MSHTEGPVGEAATDRDHLYVGPVIANIVSDLLEAPEGGKVGDRIGKDYFPAQRHARGDARHILLGHRRIEEAVRES